MNKNESKILFITTKLNKKGEWIFKNICNKKGQLVAMFGWDGLCTSFQYNEKNQLVRQTEGGADSELYSIVEYEYIDNKVIITENMIDEGKIIKEELLMSPEYDKVIELKEFIFDNTSKTFVEIEVGSVRTELERELKISDIHVEHFRFAPIYGLLTVEDDESYIIQNEYWD